MVTAIDNEGRVRMVELSPDGRTALLPGPDRPRYLDTQAGTYKFDRVEGGIGVYNRTITWELPSLPTPPSESEEGEDSGGGPESPEIPLGQDDYPFLAQQEPAEAI